MDLIDPHSSDALKYSIQSGLLPEPQPLTEEEELQKFIKDYIDEPPPKPTWRSHMDKMLAYTQMYGGSGRKIGKSFGYHPNYVIIDEFFPNHEKPTFKPTKKQAKLLKKFRKLKRFK